MDDAWFPSKGDTRRAVRLSPVRGAGGGSRPPSRAGSAAGVAAGRLDEASEAGGVAHRQLGQDLAVERDAGLLEAAHELRVRRAEGAAPRIDPQDPERAELALLGAAVPVGEGQGPGDGLRGALVETPAAAPVALGLLEHLLPTLASLRPTLGAGHGKSSLRLTWARGEASRTSPGAGLPRRGTPAPRYAGPGLGVGSTCPTGRARAGECASGRRGPAACSSEACASASATSPRACAASSHRPARACRTPSA